MAKDEKHTDNIEKKESEPSKEDKRPKEEEHETLIRILSYDIPGSKSVGVGLTKIKGVSWTIAKVISIKLGIPPSKKFQDLSEDEIKKIEDFLENPDIPGFLKNRRSDPETGEELHLKGTDLELKKEFDIKRLKKMRSYVGIRHASRLPVRGQRTRANFRSKGKAVGVKRKKK
jgi:small subunit ribosomal protein S13